MTSLFSHNLWDVLSCIVRVSCGEEQLSHKDCFRLVEMFLVAICVGTSEMLQMSHSAGFGVRLAQN